MTVTLINPNLVLQRKDPFTTGIVYMPLGLAYLAASLRAAGHEVQVIDAFGEAPERFWEQQEFLLRGLHPAETAERISSRSTMTFVYAGNLVSHRAIRRLISQIKGRWPSVPVTVVENTQAVTSYSLRQVLDEFFTAGADFVLTGEAEERGLRLLQQLQHSLPVEPLDGLAVHRNGRIHYDPPQQFIADLDQLPFPAWELFPVENYWRLGHAHGPVETGRYLPLLTSRGCPYPCAFCVVPELSQLRWRPRSARNVVDEMQEHSRRFQVHEFHLEDLDPSVSDRRMREISQEILNRGLQIVWKLAAGTKAETIRGQGTLELMYRAGCRYISISPESGSRRVLEWMRKPVDFEHAVQLVGSMQELGIRSQACFVLGFPGEEEADRSLTRTLVRRLARAGLDEVAFFIMSPVPGSAAYGQIQGYQELSQLSFSPTWRTDYALLSRVRLRLYVEFILLKLWLHPTRILRQAWNFLRARFETKMEMAPYRAMHTIWHILWARRMS
jgi:radical SAM superfamily enzyme YgiQ (UPF0313 family)